MAGLKRSGRSLERWNDDRVSLKKRSIDRLVTYQECYSSLKFYHNEFYDRSLIAPFRKDNYLEQNYIDFDILLSYIFAIKIYNHDPSTMFSVRR